MQECFLLTAGCPDAGEDVPQKGCTQCSVLCFLLFFKLKIHLISKSTLLTLHLSKTSKLQEVGGLFFFFFSFEGEKGERRAELGNLKPWKAIISETSASLSPLQCTAPGRRMEDFP